MINIEKPAQLKGYLIDRGLLLPNEAVAIEALAGGVSNRTMLVERESGEAWVIKQALAKLRTQADWFSDRSRIQREALALQWLPAITPDETIPRFVFADDDAHILAMSAVPQPHTNWKMMLLAGDVNADDVRQFGTILASIHQGASSQRSVMQAIFAERGFFESLRVEPYYQYSASQVPQSADFLHELIADTHANIHTLVHGDYSPKNILVYQHRLILLDHEVIHWGDPAFDLGFSLTHLLSKAHHLSSARHAFLSAAALYWKSYIKGLDDVAWRDGLERRAVRHTLGCLLARVDGRSPLEYLSDTERVAQRRAVLKLMSTPPKQITELIGAFAEAITS